MQGEFPPAGLKCLCSFGILSPKLETIGTSGDAPQAVASDDTPATEGKFKELEVKLENGVQIIKLNRPKKYNAITWEVSKMRIYHTYNLQAQLPRPFVA